MIRGQPEILTTECYCEPEYYYILISCVLTPLSIVILWPGCTHGVGFSSTEHHFLVQLNHFKWPRGLCSSKKFTHRHSARHLAQIV